MKIAGEAWCLIEAKTQEVLPYQTPEKPVWVAGIERGDAGYWDTLVLLLPQALSQFISGETPQDHLQSLASRTLV